MKKFKFSLEKLQNLKNRQEKLQKMELGKINSQANILKNKIEENSKGRFQVGAETNHEDWNSLQLYYSHVTASIGQDKYYHKDLEKVEKIKKDAIIKYRVAMKDKKAVEKLYEKEFAAYKREVRMSTYKDINEKCIRVGGEVNGTI